MRLERIALNSMVGTCVSSLLIPFTCVLRRIRRRLLTCASELWSWRQESEQAPTMANILVQFCHPVPMQQRYICEEDPTVNLLLDSGETNLDDHIDRSLTLKPYRI
jgi:hypothetical protein